MAITEIMLIQAKDRQIEKLEGEVLLRDSVIKLRNEQIIQIQKELVETKEQLKIAMQELKEINEMSGLEFQRTGFESETAEQQKVSAILVTTASIITNLHRYIYHLLIFSSLGTMALKCRLVAVSSQWWFRGKYTFEEALT